MCDTIKKTMYRPGAQSKGKNTCMWKNTAPLTVMRSMIHKQSIVGAEVHSEANLSSTSHQNPNPFSHKFPLGRKEEFSGDVR